MMLKKNQNKKHYGTIRTLLLNCLKLLDNGRHPQVRIQCFLPLLCKYNRNAVIIINLAINSVLLLPPRGENFNLFINLKKLIFRRILMLFFLISIFLLSLIAAQVFCAALKRNFSLHSLSCSCCQRALWEQILDKKCKKWIYEHFYSEDGWKLGQANQRN